jgi:hypothetical protein
MNKFSAPRGNGGARQKSGPFSLALIQVLRRVLRFFLGLKAMNFTVCGSSWATHVHEPPMIIGNFTDCVGLLLRFSALHLQPPGLRQPV